jgi:hypothetical protein
MTLTLRLWQIVTVTALAALLVGVGAGRYLVPAKSEPEGVKVDLPDGTGTLYLRDQPTADDFQRRAATSEVEANVRAAIPALEAYNADHANGYAGATVEKLRASYDAGIKDVTLVRADRSTYCIESSVGSAVYHKEGPAGDIVEGHCP